VGAETPSADNIPSPTDGVKGRRPGGKKTSGDDRQSWLREQEMLRRLALAARAGAPYPQYEPYIQHERYANG